MAAVQNSVCISLAIDESTDVNDLLHHNNMGWMERMLLNQLLFTAAQVEKQHSSQTFLQDMHKMDVVAFLVDITGHINEFNLKMQVQKKNSLSDLNKFVCSCLAKRDIFEKDLQRECVHFPQVLEQIHGERDISAYVCFIDQLIGKCCQRFDSFKLCLSAN